MTHSDDRLDREYENAKARDDWQGMAAAHALRMRNRDHACQARDEIKDTDDEIVPFLIFVGIPLFALLLLCIGLAQ